MSIVSNSPLYWPILGELQFEGYLRVITIVTVCYDYVLTIGREVDFVFVSFARPTQQINISQPYRKGLGH
ncbi:hypothetical protein BV22DRAFT_1037206 [Leucogyrophana mollusca]|uniref:Uncharacterized protein n=1 Tax=Leucogyrophana mollusca TaxID=85980 RepID=A0ACB8BAJ0_9AGAM|nr:hypothetical protein BV22DRAFT_1037206 [Leucogyrophana mollusca]